MDNHSELDNIDFTTIEALYHQYKSNPDALDDEWNFFFKGFELAITDYKHLKKNTSFENPDIVNEFKVINLINAYRERGHYFTKTNPVRTRRKYSPTLDIENFDLKQEDLSKKFFAGNELGIGAATLQEIIAFLQHTYCQSIGVEFMYIRKPEIVEWLKKKMESNKNTPSFSPSEKKKILENTVKAVLFEKFVRMKFPGQKSFSLEGAEALIPALNAIVEKSIDNDCEEFVIGMSHRGRLNVLANILHKPYQDIFSEFEGKPYDEDTLLGDVKYHLGYSSDYISESGKKIHLTLSPNPSHLEAVDPVVQGIVRAKQDLHYQKNFDKVVPILIHGDAAIAGQGVVYEVIQMSELNGYKVGGTIHLVINNQLGFTTNYLDGRSGIYCTDVAKILQTPIFHVNGDDVEAVVYTVQLALEYRKTFHKDVFIDLLCYRKFGHNESDEPRFTQPILYKIIEKHPDILKIYSSKLLQENIITEQEIKNLEQEFIKQLEEDFILSKEKITSTIAPFMGDVWKHLKKATSADSENVICDTSADKTLLLDIGKKLCALPEGKAFFYKIKKLQETREKMLENNALDWAMCELLAYGSLVSEGIPVRLSGQDVKRGTFSHRHAVLTVEDSEEEYIPLQNISPTQAPFEIYNSLLSEYGVLGFEYGYALASPDALTIWEAQFGDFSNGAQIIIDQFLSSAEEKWNVFNGLVVYLPHGYEGQGPEHSSARIERFLNLCADNNIQIANCTTPANLFHILRRQVKRKFRKPLILFTPKSLLRHPLCVSSLDDLVNGQFHPVIDDNVSEKNAITRILLCSGKIFYELLDERNKNPHPHTAILRIEQLYPFPDETLQKILSSYPNKKELIWVQEEPANMGAAEFIKKKLKDLLTFSVTRPESASPATGSIQTHKITQKKLIEKAFGKCTCEKKLLECNMNCAKDLK